ncbi:MAG: DegQ family serine endoprotease [Nitrospirota bacterium]
MKKKIINSIIILSLVFLLGGLTFYYLSKTIGNQVYTPRIAAPNVPRQIMETSRAFSEIVSTVSPAVVNISTTKIINRDANLEDPLFEFFDPFREFDIPEKRKEQSLGSGVIVSPDGYIVTNNHVVEEGKDIKVTLLDRSSFKGKIVGTDPKTDIAILKIDANSLPMLKWGDSEKLQVGEFVLAIGNPYGLSHTVTMGIISAVGRANVGIADYEDFIQTDAAINPGNSGGPLVNIKGELIGINTAIFSRTGGYQGIGFAVPSNMVRLVMEQLVQSGKVTRGWVGVTIQDLTPELSHKFGFKKAGGAIVSDVAKGSPAWEAGIRKDDIVVEFNGKEVKDVSNLRNMVAQSKIGVKIPIKIFRSGKEYTLKALVVEYPRDAAADVPHQLPANTDAEALAGLTVKDLTKEIIRQLGLNKDEKGVIVLKVKPGSPADEAEVKKGDIIKEIERKVINSTKEFYEVASNMKNNEAVLLFIDRGGKKFYVVLKAF